MSNKDKTAATSDRLSIAGLLAVLLVCNFWFFSQVLYYTVGEAL